MVLRRHFVKRNVERHEFLAVKSSVERLEVRVEVLNHDLHRLTHQVGDIAEDVNELRTDVNELKTDMNELKTDMSARFGALEKAIADGHAVLLSAILKLAPR